MIKNIPTHNKVELVELNFAIKGDARWSYDTAILRCERMGALHPAINGFNYGGALFGTERYIAITLDLQYMAKHNIDPQTELDAIVATLYAPIEPTEGIKDVHVGYNPWTEQKGYTRHDYYNNS